LLNEIFAAKINQDKIYHTNMSMYEKYHNKYDATSESIQNMKQL